MPATVHHSRLVRRPPPATAADLHPNAAHQHPMISTAAVTVKVTTVTVGQEVTPVLEPVLERQVLEWVGWRCVG